MNAQHTPTPRPAFLQQNFANARAIIATFQTLDLAEAEAVDSWLLRATVSGSMTHEERSLYDWINERDELPQVSA